MLLNLFFGSYLSQAADDCAGLLNSFTLYISSTDAITGITTLEETLLLLPIVTTHRKKVANVKSREGVEGKYPSRASFSQ